MENSQFISSIKKKLKMGIGENEETIQFYIFYVSHEIC